MRRAKTIKNAKQLRKKLTEAETILWSELKGRRLGGHKFRRQHPIGPYITDFAHLPSKLVIEIDGDTHGTEREIEYDARRTDYMQKLGWTVLRAWNEDIYRNLDGVCEDILRHIG